MIENERGGCPVRRRTSSDTSAQRCGRTDSNMVENAYVHHGCSPLLANAALNSQYSASHATATPVHRTAGAMVCRWQQSAERMRTMTIRVTQESWCM